MIKNNQPWIALLVAIAFAWLVHVSAMPLSAAGESERPRPEVVDQSIQPDVEQAPGFVEQLSPDWHPPAKAKVTTVLIIAGAALALGFIIFLIRGIG